MKKLLTFIVLAAFIPSAFSATRVHSYTKKSGKYVMPHYRSSEDSKKYNNYSAKENVNPYTGKKGTKS